VRGEYRGWELFAIAYFTMLYVCGVGTGVPFFFKQWVRQAQGHNRT